MTDWLDALRGVDVPTALVSIVATEGSAPRGPGTRMVVTATTQHGTIGGGQLEYRAIEQARAILEWPAGCWRIQDYPLGPLLGQCCGGRVRLLVEHVDPAGLGWLAEAADERVVMTTLLPNRVERRIGDIATPPPSARGEVPPALRLAETIGERRRPVYLFGAGHVGQAIARHARSLPLRLAWFDTRADLADIDGVAVVPAERLADCVAEAPADAAIVILTHDHALDYALARAALMRAPPAFVGLIGSSTKRARFDSRLAADGVSAAARVRLTCPIGVPGITGKDPEVIAIATLAQLLQLGR